MALRAALIAADFPTKIYYVAYRNNAAVRLQDVGTVSDAVENIRNLGLAAAVECAPIAGQPGLRAMQVFEKALDEGLMVRFAGEAIAVAPPFMCSDADITAMADGLRRALRAVPHA